MIKIHQGGLPMATKNYIIDNPTLMAEWDWEKNNELQLNPQKLTLGSGKNAHWKCQLGHHWQARIGHRGNGIGCPYCSGRCPIKGENDLQTVNPLLAQEWNYNKNTDVQPTELTKGSNQKVWWRCSKGHEWQASVSSRVRGNGCPHCYKESRRKKSE